MSDYLHNHKNFRDLLRIVGAELNIEPGLIEKDYWIMHVLFGLKQQGFQFELKGGTSLSKGYGIIHRFSEDIDLHIKPPAEMEINENPNNNKPRNIQKRKDFYDGLADEIKINGIIAVKRDETFDDLKQYRSGGIRLHYESIMETIEGVKEGILLEVGFDTVTPNNPLTISSWAYEKAIQQKVDIIDNRAVDIACYHIGYTFVEKLQTIATKFRQEQEDKIERQNLMRQYYDVYSLLQDNTVKSFIGTKEYQKHKEARFPPKDYEILIADNEAFLLKNLELRERFIKRYKKTAKLYYKGQPDFDELLVEIGKWVEKL
ncbi:nucleotidyl transferase AbiEii/AbiGii toxin family protein [Flavobacterium sp. LB2P53]|uniref:nucleotidyl transferase AbiEii/AbiGii toxin family protein n=1 Tax=Flavobacterium sp. LB2P53 TaxID=2497481 RepID=UPI000F819762|nr:nucleotidyl transferase AbiEii/AbiGii toxin family protein [Flavobacterium sp. LB2P53]RTY64795.1 nucleotidyl transferase AbiEii/AbiGii toxin family protein [Flavobacterium sp. LB2P53]